MVHGVDPVAWPMLVPVKAPPQVSPIEQAKVHPVGKAFCVKNVVMSKVFPEPPLANAWLLKGVAIDFGVRADEQSLFYVIVIESFV